MSKENVNAVDEALKLPGKKEFEQVLTEKLAAGEEQDANNLIVVLTDVDNFLRVNENFGFEKGDEVLIAIGRHLAANLSDDAQLFRLHGDSFAILFDGEKEKEDVFLLMEKARESLDVKLPDGSPMTISIGVAAAFDDASRYFELIRKADGALFRSKTGGRNRVALAREEKMVTKTSHYTTDQLKRLTLLSKQEGVGEAVLLREALDMLLNKYSH